MAASSGSTVMAPPWAGTSMSAPVPVVAGSVNVCRLAVAAEVMTTAA